jgi:hypothetical protein
MNSRMLELAADQHTAELRAQATSAARSSTAPHPAELPASGARHPIRRRTGWALVSVGLWLASADH